MAAGVTLSIMGWLARELWGAVKDLRRDMSTLRESIAKEYTPRNDFKELSKEFTQEMRVMFREIIDKLDKKADK